MRGSAFIAFFGIATAVSGSLIGCGDDDEAPAAPKITRSGENESCTRTDDCSEGLACVNNICLDSGSGTGGTDNTGGSAGTGKGGSTSSPLGGDGETCSRRADCQTNLGCFNGRCAATDTGEGGTGGGTIPTRGQRGETCVISSDCDTGLVCRPGGQLTSVGVCVDGDTTIDPTGNVCGAECLMDDDCCELPVEVQTTLAVKSCTEIDVDLTGVNCATTAVLLQQQLCFARDAYCECAAGAWSCEAGACSYNAPCSASGLTRGGCPTFSRSGRGLVSTCDITDTMRCQSAGVDPLCMDAADCDGLAVTDDIGGDICVAGECTCFEGACYRRCSEDLDCRAGRRCDTADDVCVPVDSCSSDLTCVAALRDARAVCTPAPNRACSIPCLTDLDCNTSLIGNQFGAVCNDDGLCQAIGCTRHEDCPGAMSGARLFCTEPAAAAGVRGVESAITE